MENKHDMRFFILVLVIITLTIAFMVQSSKPQERRTDPFRCSDARVYFEQVGVSVDCDKIECEVNHDCNS